MKFFVSIFIVALTISCNSKLPTGIIEQEKMEQILWEQMKADAFTREFIAKDTTKKLETENLKLQQKIFEKYDTDKKTFYKSYQYYLKHTKIMKPLLDSIVAKQTIIKQREFENKMSSKTPIDWLAPFKKQPILVLPAYKLNGILIVKDTLQPINVVKPNVRNRIKPYFFKKQTDSTREKEAALPI